MMVLCCVKCRLLWHCHYDSIHYDVGELHCEQEDRLEAQEELDPHGREQHT